MVPQTFGKQFDPDFLFIAILSLYIEVTAVVIFDTVHQALITHTGGCILLWSPHSCMHGINMEIAVYVYTITDWGNPDLLQLIVW